MLKTEAVLGRDKVHTLLVHGQIDPPKVVFLDEEEMLLARSLDGMHPPLNLLRPAIKRPSVFATRGMVNTPQMMANLAVKHGFVFATDFNLNNIEASNNSTDSSSARLDRFTLYERMTAKVDQWEKASDGEISRDAEQSTRKFVHRLRQIAASWYSIELSEDPLIKKMADGINNPRLPEKDAVLKAVGDMLRVDSFNMSDIYNELNNIIDPQGKKAANPETQELISKIKDKERQQESNQDTRDDRESVNELEGIAEAVVETYKSKKRREAQLELLYFHDPVLDEPSQVAADHFRRYVNKPF